jgi:hypothetical protein
MPDLEMLLPIEYRQTPVSHEFGPAIKCPGGTLIDKNGQAVVSPDQWWQYNDGGRYDAGFIGDVGDCVTRAIAIATERPYREIYDAICALAVSECGYAQAHMGVTDIAIKGYLGSLGWRWNKYRGHLNAEELPGGRLIVALKGHLVAVVDGIIHDTYDCSVGGTSEVTGYYLKSDSGDSIY